MTPRLLWAALGALVAAAACAHDEPPHARPAEVPIGTGGGAGGGGGDGEPLPAGADNGGPAAGGASGSGGALGDVDAKQGVDGATLGVGVASLGSVKKSGSWATAEDGRKVLGATTQSVSYMIRDGRVTGISVQLSGDECAALERALRAKLGAPNGPPTQTSLLDWRAKTVEVSYSPVAFTFNLQITASKG